MARLLLALGLGCLFAMVVGFALAAETMPDETAPAERPKSIKKLMREGFTRPTTPGSRAFRGIATEADLERLSKIVAELARHEPPAGTAADWRTRIDELAAAVAAALLKEEGSIDRLRAATRCVDCHRAHHPP